MEYLSSAEVWRIALVTLAAISLLVSSWVCVQALFPKFIRAAQESFDRPWLNLLLGLGVAVGVGVCSGLLIKVLPGLGRVFGGITSGVLLFVALAGSAGLARRIGSGLLHPTDKEQPWRRTLRGGVVLGGTMLVPILNAVTFSAVLVFGLGAGLRTILKMRSEAKAAGTED